MIKTWLEGVMGIWPDELLGVLWPYRMMTRTPTRETLSASCTGSKPSYQQKLD